jgi:hypothetical protein
MKMTSEMKVMQDIDPKVYEEEYSKPVHKIGRITCLGAAACMFLPSLWLYLQYGVFPPVDALVLGMGLALTYAVPFWIIEPISYYPTLGNAGMYMSMLAGNVSNMRLPCAAVAQAVAGVEEGSKKGELVATVGIAISIWLSIIAVLIGAVGTGWIVTSFSPPIQDAFKRFLLPAVFGAVFGQFVLRGPKYAPAALILALVPLYLKWPPYVTIPLAVFGTMLFGRLLYRRGKTQTPEGEGRP